MSDDRVTRLARDLRAAAPPSLLTVLERGLRDSYGATSAEMLIADYGLSVLQPVISQARDGLMADADPVPIEDSPPGQAYISQEPHIGPEPAADVYLPVTVRGDRLGVLAVSFPGRPGPAVVAELAELTAILAHEIVVAERDTDLFVQARRRQRLTLAAEIQWQLLPGRACIRPEYAIGAQLEPAYAIGTDNFDWTSDGRTLTVTVSNGMGEGMEGALLTSLAVGALRNARRAGVGLADQASLADQAIYAQHRGALHMATLLLQFDLLTGKIAVIDAGSPRVLRVRNDEIEPMLFDAQLPLGMFDRTRYIEESFSAYPGDRYVIVSDGVHAARSADGAEYGSGPLQRAVVASRDVAPPEAARAILRDLLASTALTDDAVVFCLDWRGRA